MSFLARWNGMAAAAAAEAVLPCCGSRAWAAGLARRRPLGTLPELLAASDSAWWSLGPEDWDEAFRSHPRLGGTQAAGHATAEALRWSADEQRGVAAVEGDVEDDLQRRLRVGNVAYEARFGRVFLLRAAGRDAAEVLAELDRRLQGTDEAELQEAAEQQREITHLRLQRWLSEQEAREAAV